MTSPQKPTVPYAGVLFFPQWSVLWSEISVKGHPLHEWAGYINRHQQRLRQRKLFQVIRIEAGKGLPVPQLVTARWLQLLRVFAVGLMAVLAIYWLFSVAL